MSAPTAVGALDADVVVQREGFRMQATLDVAAGGRLAVLGPNGSGKSTLIGALAGLLPLTAGKVCLDGRVLERAGGPRTRPEHRRIALLDQKPRLFPHLSVAQNIAFAPRARGMARADALRAAESWLDRLGLSGRGGDRPHRLSGGSSSESRSRERWRRSRSWYCSTSRSRRWMLKARHWCAGCWPKN